jgi:hypothetical protein
MFSMGVLFVLCGLAIMTFGLFLFYAWLPIIYGLFGLDMGLLLGHWLTGDIGLLAIIMGIAFAVVLACAAYVLEPYRRLLLGISGGALLGLSLGYLLQLDTPLGGVFGTALAIGGGLIGAMIVPRFFDAFVVAASAFGGATMTMAGAHLMMPSVELFDRAAARGLLPALLTLILTLLGLAWQFRNIVAWTQFEPMPGGVSADTKMTHGGGKRVP